MKAVAGQIRFVCLSDTHLTSGFVVPDGDVLLHAGDFSRRDTLDSIQRFNDFLASLPHSIKIAIAGNHDYAFDPSTQHLTTPNPPPLAATYLQDSGMEVYGYRIWGSPWIRSNNPGAFSFKDEGPLVEKFAKIPAGVDILMTHSPGFGVLDLNKLGVRRGSEVLRKRIEEVQPKVHVFGHIHEGYGVHSTPSLLSLNSAICDPTFRPTHAPQTFTLPVR